MNTVTILPGTDKQQKKESFDQLELHCGELYTIVGNTGSGKSRLIKDIEHLVDADSVSGRRILIDHKPVDLKKRNELSSCYISHLSQNMRFVLDSTVEEFLSLHAKCRHAEHVDLQAVVDLANSITPEAIHLSMNLNALSGGQSRALMVADIACICDTPIVLIDEIENAGINKSAALKALLDRKKLVLIVTHDPHTALMAKHRIIMSNGAVHAVVAKNEEEDAILMQLDALYDYTYNLQSELRLGNHLTGSKIEL